MQRLFRRASVSGIALAVTGLLFGAVATEAGSPLVKVSGPSPYAGCDISSFLLKGETNYLNAEVEPQIGLNPRDSENIIGVWQQDRYTSGGARGLVSGVSHDGGTTWKRNSPHFTVCSGGTPANEGNFERASDPWVSFSRNGTAHQISLSFDFARDTNQGILVSRSTNKGDSWSEPIVLQYDTDPLVAQDKESITADPLDSRFVYAVWDRLVLNADSTRILNGPTWFARTTDGGKTWEPARVIYDPGMGQADSDTQTIGNVIVVLPNGELVDMVVRILHATEVPPTKDPNDFTIVVLRSRDKGATWSEPMVVNTLESRATLESDATGIHDPKTGEPVRTGDIIPSIAVDRESGALYIAWQDARFSGHKRDGIALSKSTNGGLTWSAPVQVNKAPGVQAFTATVDVAAESGTVGVTYYDLRKDNSDPKVLLTDYWKVVSHDGGKKFAEQHLGGSFDMRTAPFARGFFVGDYEALTHLDQTFVPFFVMANSGNLSNRTDVFVKPLRQDEDDASDTAGDSAALAPSADASNVTAPRAMVASPTGSTVGPTVGIRRSR